MVKHMPGGLFPVFGCFEPSNSNYHVFTMNHRGAPHLWGIVSKLSIISQIAKQAVKQPRVLDRKCHGLERKNGVSPLFPVWDSHGFDRNR